MVYVYVDVMRLHEVVDLNVKFVCEIDDFEMNEVDEINLDLEAFYNLFEVVEIMVVDVLDVLEVFEVVCLVMVEVMILIYLDDKGEVLMKQQEIPFEEI